MLVENKAQYKSSHGYAHL